MGMMKEFKEFAMRGNVVDMAVGVIIGGAFGKIVTSMVNDILMPPIGYMMGGVKFTELKYTISEAIPAEMGADGETVVKEAVDAVTINYGNLIQNIIDFLIVAFCIFMVIRGMNKLKKKEEEAPAAPPEPSKEEVLLTEIRDALRNK